jgi:hypothetical protein
MTYAWLADAVLVLHLGFIAFAVGGVLAVWRWPRLAWLHVPGMIWGSYVVLAGEVCPLTPLENALRRAGGEAGDSRSFIAHYLLPLIYPEAVQGEMGRGLQAALGAGLLVLNLLAYALLYARLWRRRNS